MELASGAAKSLPDTDPLETPVQSLHFSVFSVFSVAA